MTKQHDFAGTGLSASAAKALVAPGKVEKNTKCLPSGRFYAILNESLNNHPERDWWPEDEPESFIALPAGGDLRPNALAWWPVWNAKPYLWSYQKGFGHSRRADIMRAARRTVESQISPLRRRGFHVHHAETPFKRLFDDFCALIGVEEARIELESGEKAGEIYFRDTHFALLWLMYHGAHARLEVLTVGQHRTIHGLSKDE